MSLDVRWPLPPAGKPSLAWNTASRLILPAVGTLTKIFGKYLTKFEYHNVDRLVAQIEKRPKGVPLITACNHHSCMDDPLVWSMLPLRILWRNNQMRWSLAAHDICFTTRRHAYFFAFGQSVPVIRGEGVYQRAMDYCVELLNLGKWVHIYPEGRVNMEPSEFLRLKWGVGRLMADSAECPLVVPFWHVGMDSVLPNVEPYMPQLGQLVTLNVGPVIDLTELKRKMEADGCDATDRRKRFTDVIQEHFARLREETERIHAHRLKRMHNNNDKR